MPSGKANCSPKLLTVSQLGLVAGCTEGNPERPWYLGRRKKGRWAEDVTDSLALSSLSKAVHHGWFKIKMWEQDLTLLVTILTTSQNSMCLTHHHPHPRSRTQIEKKKKKRDSIPDDLQDKHLVYWGALTKLLNSYFLYSSNRWCTPIFKPADG